MNLFEDYHPIKSDDRKRKTLSAKMRKAFIRPQKTSPPHSRMHILIAVAAVLLFIIGLSLFVDKTQAPHSTADLGDDQSTHSDDQNFITSTNPEVTSKHLTFAGESKHWKAVNKVYVRQVWGPEGFKKFEEGVFKLSYKGKLPEKKGKFELDIDGSSKGSHLSGDRMFPKNGVYGNNGVYGSYKDDEITVTVEWNGKKETFKMISQKDAFRKKTIAERPNLSGVRSYKGNRFIGIAGKGNFQLASRVYNWGKLGKAVVFNLGEAGVDKYIPALFSARGQNLEQTLFFLLKGVSSSDDIQIVGTHKGKQKVVLSGIQNERILKERFGSEIAIPAVVKFAEEGVWKLTAYVNGEEFGSATIGVYQKPAIYNTTSSLLKGDTLLTIGGKIKSDWQYNKGLLSLGTKPHMQLEIRTELSKKMPIKNPFPIVIMGVPITEGRPFVQIFSKSDVVEKDGEYMFDTTLPIQKQGKWHLKVFVGDYPMGYVTFFVR